MTTIEILNLLELLISRTQNILDTISDLFIKHPSFLAVFHNIQNTLNAYSAFCYSL